MTSPDSEALPQEGEQPITYPSGHFGSVLLTVITAAYNAASTITETIESVLALGPEVQIIVIDDGSTDDTARIVQSFGSRIELLQHGNRGKSASRNRGLTHARGEFVLFLDADDMVRPSLIVDLLEAIGTLPYSDVYYGPYYIADERGNVQKLLGVEEFTDHPLRSILIQNRFGLLATLSRTSLVKSLGGFDVNLRSSEDWDLWIRVSESGATFTRLEKPLAIYRVMPGSNSKDFSRMWQALVRIQRKHRQTIQGMKNGRKIFSMQIDHLLDRDLKNIYGHDLNDPWLQRRLRRSFYVLRIIAKHPDSFPSFVRRFVRRAISGRSKA